MGQPRFAWVEPYESIATAIYHLKDGEQLLLDCYHHVFGPETGLSFSFYRGERIDEAGIDPFSFFCSFNCQIKEERRAKTVAAIMHELGIAGEAPRDFAGVPLQSNMRSWFIASARERSAGDVECLWEMFRAAIAYADAPDAATRADFVTAFDRVRGQRCINWNLSMALFWMRPRAYLPLGDRSRRYLAERGFTLPQRSLPSGEAYLALTAGVAERLEAPLYEISQDAFAWTAKTDAKKGWVPALDVYDPGIDEEVWAQLIEDPTVFDAASRELVGHLRDAGGKATPKQLAKRFGGSADRYLETAAALAERVAKRTGCPRYAGGPDDDRRWWAVLFLGKKAGKKDDGIYQWRLRPELAAVLDEERPAHAQGSEGAGSSLQGETAFGTAASRDGARAGDAAEAGADGAAASAALREPADPAEASPAPYTVRQFLDEVYVNPSGLAAMRGLPLRKKNLILQGAPGTGKTFAAERLAWLLLGEADEGRIERTVFHRALSYEDVVVRADRCGTGDPVVREGVFLQFCRRAAADPARPYVFIADEINRADIASVFGELIELIDADRRGDALVLPGCGRAVSVPENIYIIGTMSDANRALALTDYVVRRRFGFFEMMPAFEEPAFQERIDRVGSGKLAMLADQVRAINKMIADDLALGAGCVIGHSYFCVDEGVTDAAVEGIARCEIEPLIASLWAGNPDRVRALTAQIEGALKL